MDILKKILTLITPFLILSCAGSSYLKSSEPINVFLNTQKLDKSKKYILQKDKAPNRAALRLFNGGEGEVHIIDPLDPIDFTNGLFVEKHWKEMYRKYAQDTLTKYWKKEDFPDYDFVLENSKGLFGAEFHDRYINSRIEDVIRISEPMYYNRKKYILFYFNMESFFGSTKPQVVIMKKEKEKWVVVRVIGDYVYY
jgi:hypothetical protein